MFQLMETIEKDENVNRILDKAIGCYMLFFISFEPNMANISMQKRINIILKHSCKILNFGFFNLENKELLYPPIRTIEARSQA
jgi:hypothetical protein